MSTLTSRPELLVPSDLDWFHIVDVSDTTSSPQGTSKKIKKSALFANIGGGAWGEINGTLSNQTDLQSALDGKSNVGHSHTWGQITGKPTTFPPSTHTHAYSTLTGLPTLFTETQADGRYFTKANGSGGDANDAIVDGTYQGRPFSANHPGGASHGRMLVFGQAYSGTSQIFIDDVGGTFFRGQNYLGTWGNWYQAWTTRNDSVLFKSNENNINGDLIVNNTNYKSNSIVINGSATEFSFLKSGNALPINTNNLLVSGSYGDRSFVPSNGAFIKGVLRVDGNEINLRGASPRLRFLEDDGTTGDWTAVVDSNTFYIRNNNVTNTRMSIASNGNVNFYGVMTNTHSITAPNFYKSSDIRLKENIQPLFGDFHTYNLKSNPEQKSYGVIADKIEKKHPELVQTNEDGFKSVNYIDLLCLKVSQLEKKISELEKRLG